jgi:DNA-binding response OmpR family regulator
MVNTILVVDDELRVTTLIESYLSKEGFRIVTAGDGSEALTVARIEKPDLILLDIMMPVMDGFEFLRLHRQEADTPVILLTARVEEDDKVIGLEFGADDYITKPFHPRELAARVRALLRRPRQSVSTRTVMQAGGIMLDRETRTVQVNSRPVNLTPSEFNLLAVFLSAPGRTFSRLDLLDNIQGVRYAGYERTINTHIKNLRAKIEAKPGSPRCIETVYGVGYRFIGS